MFRSKFIGTALVIMLGVNMGAWTLSVATSRAPNGTVTVPVTAAGIAAQSQSASAAASGAVLPAVSLSQIVYPAVPEYVPDTDTATEMTDASTTELGTTTP